MQTRAFKQVDVFTQSPYRGNPVAVVLDGSGLSSEQMQRFARWTNLSETTFLLPPTTNAADYRLRIFTPGGELPFAGHPTLGSCHAWLQTGAKARRSGVVVQECEQGLVPIRMEGERQAFAAPPLKQSPVSPCALAQVASSLGLKTDQILAAQVLDNGPVWTSVLLDDPQTLLALTPDHAVLKKLGIKVGAAARYRGASGDTAADTPALEVRAFAAAIGVPEDPVTGSLNASLAQWLIASGHMPGRYVAGQGACMDRSGRVFIERDDAGQVWVGGSSVTCIDGSVAL